MSPRVNRSLCSVSFASFSEMSSVFLLVATFLGAPASDQLGPSSAQVHLSKGQQSLEAKALQVAKAQFELAVKANPKSVEARIGLGIAEFQDGHTTAAIQSFRSALELDANSLPGHYYLALALLREQKL